MYNADLENAIAESVTEAYILSAIGVSTLSGDNTGDETTATIFTKYGNRPVTIMLEDTTTDVTVKDYYFPIPTVFNGLVLKSAKLKVITAGTTNATTGQIRNITKYASNDALSTSMSIASAGTDSTGGAIDTAYDDVVTGDMIKVSITAVSTTAPKGLFVILEYGV